MNALEVRLAFERGARAVYDRKRGDEHFVHVADVKGCNIATRARILGKPMLPHSVAKLLQLHLGNEAEEFISTSLLASLLTDGWDVVRDEHRWLQFDDEHGDSFWGGVLDGTAYPKRLVTLDGTELDPALTIVGHLDFRATRDNRTLLGEWKSVDRAFPADARWADAVQANTYALMCGSITGDTVVGMCDRRTGDYKFYDTRPLEMLDELRRLCFAAMAAYSSDPPASAEPPAAYMCKWCDYGDCARNENPERLSLEGVA